MTQLIVTLDSAGYTNEVSLISKAISLLKGVVSVRVKEPQVRETKKVADVEQDFCPDPELRRIMGIAASLKDIDTSNDERLSYILSK